MNAGSYDGLVEVGPVPTASFPRWARWAQAQLGGLPPTTEYGCHRARTKRPGGAAAGWAWSVTGNDNIHVPERWNRLRFLAESP